MKLLLVAPEVFPPWTEGRKKLVCDLEKTLKSECDVRLVTNGSSTECITKLCKWMKEGAIGKYRGMHRFHKAVEEEINEWQPDAVCHFPYGTFSGLRGIINEWSIININTKCKTKHIRCLTILYSITNGSRDILKNEVEYVTAYGTDMKTHKIYMGIDVEAIPMRKDRIHNKPTVIFMSGSQDDNMTTLKYIYEERGLEDVIRAGKYLYNAGIKVIIAIPSLRNLRIRNEVTELIMRASPGLDYELRSEVSIPNIFDEVDLLVFPYRKELTQFCPTSVLEAMLAGVPVVLSDLQMLSSLANGGRTAYQYKAGNPLELSEVIVDVLKDSDRRKTIVSNAREYVCKNMSIHNMKNRIISILREAPIQ